jgi:colanic acid/amylovoran biosynthesis protein
MPANAKNGSPVVLIINFHSTRNAGDLALLLSNRQLLQEAFGNPRIIVSANWPDEEAYAEYGFEVVPSPWALAGVRPRNPLPKQVAALVGTYVALWRHRFHQAPLKGQANQPWKRLHAAYTAADLVVGVSGNQFYSSGRYGWPFPATYASVSLAHAHNKPLYVLPQSIGPLRRKWERRMLTKGYGRARYVFLRDSISIRLANELGLPTEKVNYAPDPAFDLEPADPAETSEILQAFGAEMAKPKLGVTVIAPMGRSLVTTEVENYYAVLEHTLTRFLHKFPAQVVLFNQVSGPTPNENDGEAAAALCSRLKAHGLDAIHINQAVRPAQLKASYGLMQTFLASRLHSGIFALGMNVPTVFIGYLSKTRGMLEALELENNVIDLKDLKEQDLWEKLSYTWEHAAQERAALEVKMPEVKAASHAPAQAIREDFLRYHG